MASQGFILFVSDDDASPWRLAPVFGDAPAVEVAPSPAQVALSLRQAGYRGEGIVLALPSTWCVAATIDIANVPTRDYRSMTYRLEEHLPLAAESIVADFVVRGGRALAVCAKIDVLRETIAGLEAEGIAVKTFALDAERPNLVARIKGLGKKRPLLILENLQRQPRIQLRIISPPALELSILVVLDEVVIGITREGERIKTQRIYARQSQEAQVRLGGFEIEQRIRIFDGKRFFVAYGLHARVSCLA